MYQNGQKQNAYGILKESFRSCEKLNFQTRITRNWYMSGF